MASSNPVRRSTRKRPRARYTLDPFEGVEGIQDLSDITLSDEVGLGNDAVDTASDDDDFAMGDAGEIEEASVNDNLENQDDDVSCEDPETEPEGTAPSSSKRGRGGKQKNLERKKKEGIPRTLHRSAIIPHRYFNKQEWYIAMWGSRPEELIHLIRGRDKWCNDVTLPRREANERGEGGLAHSFFHTGELRAKEAKEDWEWYDCQEGREEFSNRQESRDLEAVEGIRYLPQPAGGSHSFLIGPMDKQTMYSLPTRASMNTADAWLDDSRRKQREGWILNAGARVECMGWVPNRHSGVQYLTIATEPTATEDSQPPTEQSEQAKSAAFSPSPPSPACIQLWAFSATEDGRTDSAHAPELKLVLCTRWGEVKQLKWCPAVRDTSHSDDRPLELGLLATVWGDGKLRVLDVHLPMRGDNVTRYVQLKEVAFQSVPPNTLCTCVDWLSSSHVAVGCANGFVGVWDISRHLRPSSAPVPAEPRPFFYHLLHQTYILDITSCYPSHPDMIATSAMDGFVRLTSIRAPDTDMVWAPRSRVGPAVLAWDDAVQCVLAAEDNGTIRAFMRRRFFKGLAVARPAAMVTSLSAGTGHPSMMAGTVDGVVMVSNPLRRVLRDRNRTRGLQQTWFTHTYSRKGGGISRFTEGFALEVPYLHSTTEGEAKIDRASDGRLLLTIHEERTAVSQVSWNPNVEVGGWAAAGMASGLVRIADLAL